VPASMLPQQIAPGGVPAPFAPPAAPPPERAAPELMAPDAAPTPLGGVVEMGEPEVQSTAGTGYVSMGQPTVKNEGQIARDQVARQQAEAAYHASPRGQLGAAQGVQNDATLARKQAVVDAATIQAAQDDAVAAAGVARDIQIDNHKAKLAATAQENLDAENKVVGRNKRLLEKMANTKIDREHDHPIMAAVGMALAVIGTAYDKKNQSENPAFKAYYNAIDRKVAAQEADLDQMAKIYGFNKEELAALKDHGRSKIEFHNMMIAAEIDKSKRHIDAYLARTASQKTKANAVTMLAEIDAHAAEKFTDAVRWGVDFDQKERAEKNQQSRHYSSLNESKRQHGLDLQYKYDALDQGELEHRMKLNASGNEAAYKARTEAEKEAREFGLKGIHGYIPTARGRALAAEADKLEAQAAALEANPDAMARSVASDKVSMLKRGAAALRDEAEVEVIKGRDAKQAGDMSKKVAATQSLQDNIDDIKMLYAKAGRGYVFTDADQMELQSKTHLVNLQLKEVSGSGAWDKGLATLYKGITGGDPTSEWDVGLWNMVLNQERARDPEGFIQMLDSVALNMRRGVTHEVNDNSTHDPKHGGPIMMDDLFTTKKAGKPNTPVDQASRDLTKAKSGVEMNNAVAPESKRADLKNYGKKLAATASQSEKYKGLSKDQEAPFEALLKAYQAGDPLAMDAIVERVRDEAVNRPGLVDPLLRNIQEHGGRKLYVAARAAVPKGSDIDNRMTIEENLRIGVGKTNTPKLVNEVMSTVTFDGKIGDQEGLAELGRLAGKGDPVAKKALLDIAAGRMFQKGPR
jgi:hypothetical protein